MIAPDRLDPTLVEAAGWGFNEASPTSRQLTVEIIAGFLNALVEDDKAMARGFAAMYEAPDADGENELRAAIAAAVTTASVRNDRQEDV